MEKIVDRKWYKGDTHLHTINSDGVLTKGQLVDYCKRKGLDFMIITDHNFNSVKESYFDKDMLVIQGQEVTGALGHVNVWGKKVPIEPPYTLDTEEDYERILSASRAAGATISVNHPFDTNWPFKNDFDKFDFDCVEVWNTVQHSDNMKNRDWWVAELLKGNRIGAIGGSDFHRNYFKLGLLAMPTTVVHAEKKTEEAILQAMREGRSVITNSPDSTMIYMTCGRAGIGDTVKLDGAQKIEVTVTDLKAGNTVTIYNNEKPIFTYTAKTGAKTFMCCADIEEKGFVRVEVTYKLFSPVKKLYKFVESKFLDSDSGEVPEFIRAFTNPIWVE